MNIVPMSHLKYLIFLSGLSLLMACGQKGSLVVNDTALNQAYAKKVKPVPVAAPSPKTPLIKTAKQRGSELDNKGYKP